MQGGVEWVLDQQADALLRPGELLALKGGSRLILLDRNCPGVTNFRLAPVPMANSGNQLVPFVRLH